MLPERPQVDRRKDSYGRLWPVCWNAHKDALHVLVTRRRKSEAARGAAGPRDLGSDHRGAINDHPPQPRANLVGYRRNKALYLLRPPMVDFDTLPIDSRVVSDGAIWRAPWPRVG